MYSHARVAGLCGLLTFCSLAVAQTTGWTNLQPTAPPPDRALEGLAFESATGLVVMFGGSGASGLLGDTWLLAGNTWLQQTPPTSPSPRTNMHMAQSPTAARVVLFGGATGPGTVDAATWEFDIGTMNWIDMTPALGPSPAARQHGGLVHDSQRGRTIVFGGTNGSGGAFFGDTWEWDGSTWTNMTPAVSPAARAWHAMTYDSVRGRTVLFGGYNGSQLGDTWEWDGSSWTQVFTPAAPPGQSSGAMAYDATSRRVVLFAGSYGWPIGLNDTWHYDGTNWYLWTPSGTIPQPQYLHRMIGCPPLGGVLVYGAYGNGWTVLNDTWLYTAPGVVASFVPFGTGCLGTGGVPTLAAAPGQLPWIGSTFTMDLTNLPNPGVGLAFGFIGLAALPSPVSLVVIGMPGCSAYIDPIVAATLPTAGGGASWPFGIPSNLALEGAHFFVQGIVIDLGVNPASLTVTNAGDGTVGSR
ncbi:MAG TPA: kelch repeat-containing protein [Gemmatimonadaceae bacterium]